MMREPLAGVRLRSDVDREILSEEQTNAALDQHAGGPDFVKGTSLWHRIRETHGDLSRTTICGRHLPAAAPTRGWIAAVWLCNKCRTEAPS